MQVLQLMSILTAVLLKNLLVVDALKTCRIFEEASSNIFNSLVALYRDGVVGNCHHSLEGK